MAYYGYNSAQGVYGAALAQESALYNQVQAGYSNLLSGVQAQEQNVTSGYNTLLADVMGRLNNLDASQRQAIKDQFTALSGQQAQEMTSRGLGNTTVAQSVEQGIALQKAKADVALTGQTQGLQAQYESQLGLAGLNWQGQAVGINAGIGGQQLQAQQAFAPVYASLYGGMGQAASAADLQQQGFQNQLAMQARQSMFGGGGVQGQGGPLSGSGPGQASAQWAAQQAAGDRAFAQQQATGQALAQQQDQFNQIQQWRYDSLTGPPSAPASGGGYAGGGYGSGPNISYAPQGSGYESLQGSGVSLGGGSSM